ncbi:MAG: CBS domain-containing protein [Tatlockia sp.]|jgi:CBS domain-containing protein
MANLIYSALPHPRRSIVFIPPDLSVADCINRLIEKNIGALVVQDKESILGIVSERDIIKACLYEGHDLHSTKARDVVYKEVSVLDLFDTVEKAMETITQTKRRHVLITEKGDLVAILSIGDLLYYLLEDKTRVIEQLENYIHTY